MKQVTRNEFTSASQRVSAGSTVSDARGAHAICFSRARCSMETATAIELVRVGCDDPTGSQLERLPWAGLPSQATHRAYATAHSTLGSDVLRDIRGSKKHCI